MGEYDKTGGAVAPLAGGGDGGHIWTKSGLAVAPLAASGPGSDDFHPVPGISRQWQRSIVGSGVWTDIEHATGLNYVVTTADRGCIIRVVEYDWNYLGSASSAATATEPYFETDHGVAASDFDVSGVANKEFSETGVGIMQPVGDIGFVYDTKTGTAASALTGHGSDSWTKTQRGTGISDRVGKGVDVWTKTRTGKAIIDNFIGKGTHA